jgi:hypothetical protein
VPATAVNVRMSGGAREDRERESEYGMTVHSGYK